MQRIFPAVVVALCSSVFMPLALAQEAAAPAPDQPGKPSDAFIQQLVGDGDGKVSLEEALAPQKEQFAEIDKDGSGDVTAEEVNEAFKSQVPQEMLDEMAKRGMADPGEGFVQNLDKNADGKVDPTEFEQPTVDSFKRLDADGDGFATAAEAEAYFEELKQRMQEKMEQMQQDAPQAQ
jgi:Ca2+-binding EF-hand superfamily protein